MKKIILIVILLFFWADPVTAIDLGQNIDTTQNSVKPEQSQGFWASRDPWTKKDTYWQTAFIFITTIDICNTAKCMETGKYYEDNPIVQKFIGKEPTPEEVYIFGAEWIVFHTIVAKALPKKYRRFWQSFVITWTTSDIVTGTVLLF